MPTPSLSPNTSLSFQHIPVFARFQWVNSPHVVNMLRRFLRPKLRGRKGYGSVILFRWLIWKWLMRCAYRDLESVSGIDYSTFIKFRKRLVASFLLPRVFETLVTSLATRAKDLRLVIDSSFVKTYSKHKENGSEYSGYKKADGYKLHTMIDYKTRLPILQIATGGARADITLGRTLIDRAPPDWRVCSLTADKGYDSEVFVQEIKEKWAKAMVGIPLRKTNG